MNDQPVNPRNPLGPSSGECIECHKETSDVFTEKTLTMPDRHFWCCNPCQPAVTIKIAENVAKHKVLDKKEKAKGKKK